MPGGEISDCLEYCVPVTSIMWLYRKLFTPFAMPDFYSTLTSLIVYIRRKHKLVVTMETTCLIVTYT